MAGNQDIWHDLAVYWRAMRVQLRANMALRGAFITQIIGMILNNLSLVVAWYFLFNAAGQINGWRVQELIAAQGINMLVYGLTMLAGAGFLDLPRHVDRGSFDTFLTRPARIIVQLCGSRLDAPAFGDIALGVALIGWYLAISDVDAIGLMLFLASLVVACTVFWCWALLLPYSLAFYIYDAERIGRYLSSIFLDTAIYPTGVLSGALRTFLLIGVPGLLMGAVQVDALRGLGWQEVGIGAIVAAVWLALSLWLFKRAVRRYESSNLIGAR